MENFEWQPIKDEDVKWWGVDFDGTLAHNTGIPEFKVLGPVDGAVKTLQLIDSIGYKITVFTARPWADYNNIEAWCDYYQVPVRRIICGKPLLHTLYDDRNWGTRINWAEVYAYYGGKIEDTPMGVIK